jgi:flagellar FliL protein
MPPPPKPEAPPPPAPPKPDRAPPAAPVEIASSAPSASGGGIKAWLPGIAAIVIGPAITWALAQFLLVPQLKKKLDLPLQPVAAEVLAEAEAAKSGKPKEASTYEFTNIVVNLAGTMGTRYLKTSFHVVGDPKANVDIKEIFDKNRTKLLDTTLNVLSSLTLADLEEAGAKNVIREKLVAAYNQALGRKVAEQVYFYDFVVQ